jgi:hypothetical protein
VRFIITISLGLGQDEGLPILEACLQKTLSPEKASFYYYSKVILVILKEHQVLGFEDNNQILIFLSHYLHCESGVPKLKSANHSKCSKHIARIVKVGESKT